MHSASKSYFLRGRVTYVQAILTPIFQTVAALLIVAGASKLRRPTALLGARAALRIPGGVLCVRALGAAEVALGAGAILAASAGTAAACACASMVFTVALIRLGRVAPEIACGCFGGAWESGRGAGGAAGAGTAGAGAVAEAGRLRLALNMLALAVCTAAAAVGVHGLPWLVRLPSVQAVAVVAGIGGCVFCAYLCFTALPAAWAAYAGVRR